MNNTIQLLDGALGTMLQKKGLLLGERPELLNLKNPALVQSVHDAYVAAGSDIIYANTFGANAHKLEGAGHSVQEVIAAGIAIAKRAAQGAACKVALDVGPIGELLEPSGTLTFEQAYDVFTEMVVAGRDAGADLIVFETMTDLYEVKAAVLAAKEHSDLPVFVTMTFEENGRTFTGCSIPAMATCLQGLGVDAMGINCSLGPVEILPLMKKLAQYTKLPLIAKPNAGLPHPETGAYDLDAQTFAQVMAEYPAIGVQYLGGCCGTTEQFLVALRARTQGATAAPRVYTPITRFCTATKVVTADTVRVIGERINPTGKKRFAQALRDGEMPYVLGQALEQVEAGAEILDVNVGVPQLDEAALMTQTVKAIQSVVDVPLQIDSSNVAALEAGLRVYNGKPLLNSVNGEDEKLHAILPLAKKYGAALVCLTMDERGIPHDAATRVEIAQKIVKMALAYGIPKEDILVDCLTLTVSAQQKDCMETLKAMATIRDTLGLQLVLGVSNISFGLPNRALINHSFLTLAMAHGLRLPILNPNAKEMMDAVDAYRVLSGYDVDSEVFIARHSGDAGDSSTGNGIAAPTANQGYTLEEAILKGLGQVVEAHTKELLKSTPPLDIVNERLIPALDVVGQKYDSGVFFLPQLIRAASACSAAFEVLKQALATGDETASLSKGTIILATVKGDIHDIGKNIVKVILENYGYKIIDLGKDVSAQQIVETAVAEHVSLVGLSALMTTTVESMRQTIVLLRESGHPCTIMVGGAVLTPEYAAKIGADFYAKDAQKAVEIAKKVLG